MIYKVEDLQVVDDEEQKKDLKMVFDILYNKMINRRKWLKHYTE